MPSSTRKCFVGCALTALGLTGSGHANADVPQPAAPLAPTAPAADVTAAPASERSDRPAPNSIYAEGLGAAMIYSFN